MVKQSINQLTKHFSFLGTLSNLSKLNNSINYNYGVAEFDLSELLNGERILYQSSPIRACKESQNVLHEISSKLFLLLFLIKRVSRGLAFIQVYYCDGV